MSHEDANVEPQMVQKDEFFSTAGVESEGVIEPETPKVVESQFDQVYDPRTPEEIEKELQDNEEKAAFERLKNQKPEDTATWFFQMMWPRYMERVARLSNKEARRVLEAIVQWPLLDDKPKFSSTEGKEAFSLGSRLIDAKTIMRDVVELEKLSEAAQQGLNQAEQTDTAKAVEQTPSLKENENGET